MVRDSEWELRLPFDPRPMSPDAASEAWRGRTTFDQCVGLATEYYSRVAGRTTVPKAELAREFAELIKQLDFLLKSAYVLHAQYFRLAPTGDRPSVDYRLQQHTAFALDLYAAMFYYVAHRAQTIALGKKTKLPGFVDYKPAIGVRTIRNDVVEHPKPEEFVSLGGSALHSHHGPRVRTMRDGRGVNSSPEGWLFPDAAEFEVAVADILTRAHAHIDGKARSDAL
jgi:hypothetical protein